MKGRLLGALTVAARPRCRVMIVRRTVTKAGLLAVALFLPPSASRRTSQSPTRKSSSGAAR